MFLSPIVVFGFLRAVVWNSYDLSPIGWPAAMVRLGFLAILGVPLLGRRLRAGRNAATQLQL
jgi:hypothetical protein